MNERRINEEEFNEAMHKVMDEMMNDPDLDGMAKLLVPMTGVSFATKMKKILFPEDKEDAE